MKIIIILSISAICSGYFVLIDQVKKMKYAKNLEKLHAEYMNNVLTAKLEIQEQTFANLSRDIHDNIGQKLSLVKFQIALQRRAGREELLPTENILGEVIADLRDLSRSIGADLVKAEGLIPAIRHEIALLEKTCKLTIELATEGEPVYLTGDKEIIIYRIYQEALQNILKHADATAIFILLRYSENWLNISIADNGKGFSGEFAGGAGLRNMDIRAKSLAGSFTAESTPTGTRLQLQVPITDQYN